MVVTANTKFPAFHLVKYQCLAAASVNIATFCHGTILSWSGPAVWLMQTEDSPLESGKISLNDASWIGGGQYIGFIIGIFLFAAVLKHLGLKIAMSLLVLPNLVAWILVICANHPFQVIIARIITGLSSGGITLLLPLFVAEIANKNIRGILGSLYFTCLCLGILFVIIVMSYVPYNITSYIFMVPGVVYSCSVMLLPETPQSLLMKNKTKEAEQSFRFYNFGNIQDGEMTFDVKSEFEELCSAVTKLADTHAKKGLMIGILLIAISLFSGNICINAYSLSIFNEVGTEVDPTISAITISSLQLVGSFVSFILIDRYGRRILLSISCIGSAISIFSFATFAFLYKSDYELSSFNWIPTTAIGVFMISTTAGLNSLSFVIVAEMLPEKFRRIGSMICFISLGIFAFINVKLFPMLSHYWGIYTVMWIFSGVCCLGLCFAIMVVTKFPAFHLVKYQCFAAASVNMATFCHGTICGWNAVAIWLMLTEDSPLESGKISLSDASWIGGGLYMGNVFGILLFAAVLKQFSLKITMSLLVLPNLVAWILVICANHPFLIIVARIIAGLSSGGATLLLPLFVAEIANKNIRGILGSLYMTFVCLGILFALIVMSYVPYNITSYIFMVPGLIYSCSVILLPETPQSLLMKNKTKEAEQSFRFYNFGNTQDGQMTVDVKSEYEDLCSAVTKLADTSTTKALMIGMLFTVISVSSGNICVNIYTLSIFNEVGAQVDPTISAITISSLQLVGLFVSFILIDRWGRRILLSISCLGSAIAMFGFATFAFLYKRDYELTSFNWIPITTIGLFMLSSIAGLVSLPYVIVAELLPEKSRRIGSMICFLFFGALAFTNVKLFPILIHYWGIYTVTWICSGVCFLGFCFAIVILEETKGKAINT
ncbi:Facilitated trehalose transporter Tret1, partial [Pseudolycoriella hygida]